MSKIIDLLKEYKYAVLLIIAITCMLLYVRNDRMLKVDILRKAYKEEYDNFDIEGHKEYINSGSYDSIPEDAKLSDYVPTKTSPLEYLCDEKRGICIEN